jgi:hypothetical protein
MRTSTGTDVIVTARQSNEVLDAIADATPRVNQVEPLDALWVDCFATLGVALYGWLSQQADTLEFNQSPPRCFAGG